MAESKLRDLSMDFSVKVIKMCDSWNVLQHLSVSVASRVDRRLYFRK